MSNEALKTALKQRDSTMEVCQRLKDLCDEKIEEIRLLECAVEQLKGYVVKEMKEGEKYRQFGCVMIKQNEELKKENADKDDEIYRLNKKYAEFKTFHNLDDYDNDYDNDSDEDSDED